MGNLFSVAIRLSSAVRARMTAMASVPSCRLADRGPGRAPRRAAGYGHAPPPADLVGRSAGCIEGEMLAIGAVGSGRGICGGAFDPPAWLRAFGDCPPAHLQ